MEVYDWIVDGFNKKIEENTWQLELYSRLDERFNKNYLLINYVNHRLVYSNRKLKQKQLLLDENN